ncbi:MAG: adenosine deaminase [Lachnospiraceae bacterium]|nr:adenosine deaminase [Lachnospiraceae bacterium]
MEHFGRLYLDKEKDIIVDLYMEGETMRYVLRTPNHGTGNLITNLAAMCGLPLSLDEDGMKIIEGTLPCYVTAENRRVFIFRLRDTKVANIYPDGTIERKASIPAISKTLMSQTKDYRLDFKKTVVKTYILSECKFRTDLHTHMNANLDPDILIALGIRHQIRYPLYYVKKLKLSITDEQERALAEQRARVAERFAESRLQGKYLTRRIDDNTFINFADLLLNNIENAGRNIPKIRASLAVMKDGQAVFTNLEKVYLYRYVFTKGKESPEQIPLQGIERIPDPDIARTLKKMLQDAETEAYGQNTIFMDKLLWIARGYAAKGIRYAEIADTTLVKSDGAAEMLRQAHEVLPKAEEETGVLIRFLAAIRRIPLTIVRDKVASFDYVRENLRVLKAVSADPYVAGSDIIGEEINDIRDMKPIIREIVKIAADEPGFVIRIHAGENDSLRDNVANSLRCVREALLPDQKMPRMRIGHGLYTANLSSPKGRQLIRELLDAEAVLEFQITSNVRLNNLSAVDIHPLKKYLKAGILCVQGTDGGALYGTDSIDEELALIKMLDLTYEELIRMRQAEDKVLAAALADFKEKTERYAGLCGEMSPEVYINERLQHSDENEDKLFGGEKRFPAAELLADRIRELPKDRIPVIIAGGSFNNDRHHTRMRKEFRDMLEALMGRLDPEKVFFVIGHRLRGYEKYVEDRARGKFEVFSFVPSVITEKAAKEILASGAYVRVSIEPEGLGVYKSFAYEIFKRRWSVLLALDGNSACVNMIQEAKNSRCKGRNYVSAHSRMLADKARSLEGYVTCLSGGPEDAERIAGDIEKRISGN